MIVCLKVIIPNVMQPKNIQIDAGMYKYTINRVFHNSRKQISSTIEHINHSKEREVITLIFSLLLPLNSIEWLFLQTEIVDLMEYQLITDS